MRTRGFLPPEMAEYFNYRLQAYGDTILALNNRFRKQVDHFKDHLPALRKYPKNYLRNQLGRPCPNWWSTLPQRRQPTARLYKHE